MLQYANNYRHYMFTITGVLFDKINHMDKLVRRQ
jgi:hypothetical protein